MQFRNGFLAALLTLPLVPHLAAQTVQLPVSILSYEAPVPLNGKVYFEGYDGTQRGLWKSDGTPGGTQLVKAFDTVTSLVPCGDQVFFNATNGAVVDLWRSDGTAAGTTLVRQGSPVNGYYGPGRGGCAGRIYYFAMPVFAASFYSTAYDLYRTDGTPGNTLLLASNTGQISTAVSARGRLYFLTPGTYSNSNVWTSDGTAAGTKLVVNLYDRIQLPLATLGSQLLFAVGSYPWPELMRTDGTSAGTVKLTSGGVLPPYSTGANALFFKDGLWSTDGTVAGTRPVHWPMTAQNPYYGFPAVASSGRLYFVAADPGQTAFSLWRSDGTNAGTASLAPMADASVLTDADGLVLFRSTSQTFVTDGTSAPVSIAPFAPDAIVKAGARAFLLSSGKLYSYDLTFAAASLAPTVVPMSGGTPITIAGIGFGAGTTVTVDGAVVTPSALAATSITFNAPAHAQGPVDVVVTRAGGQQARMQAALTFTCDTTPVAVAGGSATVCPLTPVTLTGSGGVSCSWLPATGLSDSTSCTPVATPSATTSYRLTVTNAAGCSSTNAADVVVTVNPVASAVITTTMAPTFNGDSTASVPVTAGATYHWTITNGTIVSDPNQPAITFHTGCTDAHLDVTVTAASGCPVTAGVTAHPAYPRSLYSVSPIYGTAGTTLTFSGTGLSCVTALRVGVRFITTDFHIVSDTQLTMTSAGSGRVDALINGQWVTGVSTYFSEILPVTQGDLDGDHKPDLVFRNPSTGLDAVWRMNGTSLSASTNLVSFANADYHIVGMANFDGDYANDLLLHNRVTGANAIWKMSYMSYTGVVNLPAIPDTSFELEGTGDFNGDGKPDILIRNQVTGANAVWLMNGTEMQSTANLPALPSTGYRMCGSGDFNGDGKADIVWRNASTGANAVWLMNGTSYVSTLNLPALPNSGYAIGAVADYNADNKPDVVWRNASTGANAIWLLDGGALTATVDLPPVNIPQLEMAGPW